MDSQSCSSGRQGPPLPQSNRGVFSFFSTILSASITLLHTRVSWKIHLSTWREISLVKVRQHGHLVGACVMKLVQRGGVGGAPCNRSSSRPLRDKEVTSPHALPSPLIARPSQAGTSLRLVRPSDRIVLGARRRRASRRARVARRNEIPTRLVALGAKKLCVECRDMVPRRKSGVWKESRGSRGSPMSVWS